MIRYTFCSTAKTGEPAGAEMSGTCSPGLAFDPTGEVAVVSPNGFRLVIGRYDAENHRWAHYVDGQTIWFDRLVITED